VRYPFSCSSFFTSFVDLVSFIAAPSFAGAYCFIAAGDTHTTADIKNESLCRETEGMGI
jgi:hypothetical protein